MSPEEFMEYVKRTYPSGTHWMVIAQEEHARIEKAFKLNKKINCAVGRYATGDALGLLDEQKEILEGKTNREGAKKHAPNYSREQEGKDQ